jgi:hypothetical protein
MPVIAGVRRLSLFLLDAPLLAPSVEIAEVQTL